VTRYINCTLLGVHHLLTFYVPEKWTLHNRTKIL
jgi:hypothetical protein